MSGIEENEPLVGEIIKNEEEEPVPGEKVKESLNDNKNMQTAGENVVLENGKHLGSNIEEFQAVDNRIIVGTSTDINSPILRLESNPTLSVEKDNPYAYLERHDFTSEKYKIEIRGLPKFYGIGVSILLV